MTFRLLTSRLTSCFGHISAVRSVASDMAALAIDKIRIGRADPGFDLLPQRHILPDQVQKLAHQLIALILQQLVPTHRRGTASF